jgi:hypothetical protein
MSNSLADLIKRDGVEAHWFWTHEVSTGPYSEYEVWDVVFVRNSHEPDKWVTDGDTRRTAYFRGIGGCQADSRRNTGGERREPDTAETLGNLLSDAIDADNHPTFKEWCAADERSGSAHEQLSEYQAITRTQRALKRWLGDTYDEYATAYC